MPLIIKCDYQRCGSEIDYLSDAGIQGVEFCKNPSGYEYEKNLPEFYHIWKFGVEYFTPGDTYICFECFKRWMSEIGLKPPIHDFNEYGKIRDHLKKYFKNDEDKIEAWLTSSNPLLGEIRPRDMLESGRGAKLLKFMEAQLSGQVP